MQCHTCYVSRLQSTQWLLLLYPPELGKIALPFTTLEAHFHTFLYSNQGLEKEGILKVYGLFIATSCKRHTLIRWLCVMNSSRLK